MRVITETRGQGLVNTVMVIAMFAVALGLTVYIVSEVFAATPTTTETENLVTGIKERTYSGLNLASILIIVLVATAIFTLFLRLGGWGGGVPAGGV